MFCVFIVFLIRISCFLNKPASLFQSHRSRSVECLLRALIDLERSIVKFLDHVVKCSDSQQCPVLPVFRCTGFGCNDWCGRLLFSWWVAPAVTEHSQTLLNGILIHSAPHCTEVHLASIMPHQTCILGPISNRAEIQSSRNAFSTCNKYSSLWW